jgi:hypothetical protein
MKPTLVATSFAAIIAAALVQCSWGAECSETMDVPIDTTATRLVFSGFDPNVTRFVLVLVGSPSLCRHADCSCATLTLMFHALPCQTHSFTNTGAGSRVVLKGFDRVPVVASEVGYMTITAGDKCSGTAPGPTPKATSSASGLWGFAWPLLLGTGVGGSLGQSLALSLAGGMIGQAVLVADAQTTEACQLAPIFNVG